MNLGPRSNVGDVFVCKAGWMSDCSEHVVKRVKAVNGCWLDCDLVMGIRIKKRGRMRWALERKGHEDAIFPSLREAALQALVVCAPTPLDALAIVMDKRF